MIQNKLILRKHHPLLKILNGSLYDLPCPVNLNAFWRFGSILGLCLVIQFIRGLMLSIHYVPHERLAYKSIYFFIQEYRKGWILRSIHVNGATIFFACVYIHMGRGIYYGSYLDKHVWNIGVVLYFLLIAEAFLGYRLPWGQISFWGVTVITNMFTVLPGITTESLRFLWGGWVVCGKTLQRFYSLHFIIPFIIVFVVALHLFYLHENGRNNPLGIERDYICVPFHPFYTVKDIFGFVCFGWLFIYLVCVDPELVVRKLNYEPAVYMESPKVGIEPEWYFMFAYSVVRSIPHKTRGVVLIFITIVIMFFIPYFHSGKFRRLNFYPVSQFTFWCGVGTYATITWMGFQIPKDPITNLGFYYTFLGFGIIILTPLLTGVWDKIIFWDEMKINKIKNNI